MPRRWTPSPPTADGHGQAGHAWPVRCCPCSNCKCKHLSSIPTMIYGLKSLSPGLFPPSPPAISPRPSRNICSSHKQPLSLPALLIKTTCRRGLRPRSGACPFTLRQPGEKQESFPPLGSSSPLSSLSLSGPRPSAVASPALIFGARLALQPPIFIGEALASQGGGGWLGRVGQGDARGLPSLLGSGAGPAWQAFDVQAQKPVACIWLEAPYAACPGLPSSCMQTALSTYGGYA